MWPTRLLPDDPDVGRAPYFWLLYLTFVFVGPMFAGIEGTALVWGASVASAVVFLPLFFVAYWVDGWRRMTIGLAICLVGTALSPINTGGNTYFIFGAYFGGYAAPDYRSAPKFLAPSVLALAVTSTWIQPSPFFWVPALLGVIVIGMFGVEQRRRARINAHLSMARAEVDALARIAERERIARDLHDLLGQSLSLVSLKAELATRMLAPDPKRAAAELADIQAVSRKALAEVRVAVSGYRAGAGGGLLHELAGARATLRAAGVALACEGLEPFVRQLDPAHEAVFALALREAVTNVVRHARARTCTITPQIGASELGLEIADDGHGVHGPLGHGLLGMRERAEALGGRLELAREGGTSVRVWFTRAADGRTDAGRDPDGSRDDEAPSPAPGTEDAAQ